MENLDHEELLQRLEVLARRNPEAVAVFAARCALRVLPFTAVQSVFKNWTDDMHTSSATQTFVLSILGLEYRSQRRAIYASAGKVNEAHIAIYAAANAATYAVNGNITRAATEAADAYISAASIIDEIAISATVDLNQLEQGDIESVKYYRLWLDSLSSNILGKIVAWTETMAALQLYELVQVYDDLLRGSHYPKEKILSLISDWYQQHDQVTEESASDSGSNTDQSPQTIIKYDQTHAHLYDKLAQKDSLGRERLVNAMADILAAEKNTEHQTIGLLGDWGAGKSTFIKLLKSVLEERSTAEFLFAEFNAWEYEHTDHMQAGVAREALKGLVADLGWWEELWLALKFSWRVNRLQTIRIISMTVTLIAGPIIGALQFEESLQQWIVGISIGGVSALVIWKFFIQSLQALVKSPLANEWKGLLSLPDYERYLGTIPVMKQQIQKLCTLRLGEKQRRLLFVVDDLDRCSHGGVVKTLEAVRLIMGIPQVTVIIAIDQRIALASLALHYKDLAGYHEGQDPGAIARDYLGKVIQLPVQLNAADGETVAAFVDEVLLNNTVKPTLEQDRKIPGTSTDGHDSPSIVSTAKQVTEKKKMPSAPEPINEVVEYELSPAEKSAFKACVAKYQFHNPRQLKRLYNSFNLLRHLYGGDQAGDHLQVLFWLEYLNCQPGEMRMEAEKNRNEYVSLDDERYKTVELQVKPFVLPALTVSPKKDQAQSSQKV